MPLRVFMSHVQSPTFPEVHRIARSEGLGGFRHIYVSSSVPMLLVPYRVLDDGGGGVGADHLQFYRAMIDQRYFVVSARLF